MSFGESLYSVLGYFHRDKSFNRKTLGYNPGSKWYSLVLWRVSDAVLVVILHAIYYFMDGGEPFQRQFSLNDLTISHPYATRERVNGFELMVYATWIPAIIITIISVLLSTPKLKVYTTYISLLGLALSVVSTDLITNILKNYIGRPRPDFLARCEPKEGTLKDILVFAKDVCTTKNSKRLQDGFRSTPSGHSSLSFAGLFYLSLWLSGQLMSANEVTGAWRTAITFLPSLGASIIAIGRTEDYRHHFVDVITGSLLGAIVAYWSYFRLFPSLSSEKSFVPLLADDEEDLTPAEYSQVSGV